MTTGMVQAVTLAPDPVFSSDVTVEIEQYAALPTGVSGNLASPAIIDGTLYVIDQANGQLYRDTGGSFELVDVALPTGTTLAGSSDPASPESFLNITDGPGDTVYLALTLSRGSEFGSTNIAELPATSDYSGTEYVQAIYEYTISDGDLVAPELIAGFENRNFGHFGGGLITLPDGQLAFVTGDALGFDRDGLAAPQDDTSHLGKVLLIDPDTGTVEVAAKGIRNGQRISYFDEAQSALIFSDIGAATAEELNVISLADLTDTTTVENFGWGRNGDDDKAREGTFFIDTMRMVEGEILVPEEGFESPYAQFGREDAEGFFAVTGAVTSDSSFDEIVALFGDLVSGNLFATMTDIDGLQPVFSIGLVDVFGEATSLFTLADGRPDPRFFNFADGSAGVLLEGNGTLYRLTETGAVIVDPPTPVPLPASGLLLLVGLATTGLLRRKRRA